MKVLLSWINEYLEPQISIKDFVDKITQLGHEVEHVKYLGEGLDNVVVGKIVEFDKHPNADKLFTTKVNIGKENLLSIITAATNVKLGDYVPVILPGTKLPSGLEIKPIKMRGILSEGMFGSLAEFGLLPKSEGVYVFDKEVNVGEKVIPLIGADDYLIDIASTPNRGDCLSIYGIAREISSILEDVKLKNILNLTPLITSLCSSEIISPDIIIDAKDLCHQYIGILIKGVKVQPSPSWLQTRLYLMGTRPINNIVDITNYILLETGQPLHAFDYNTLKGDKIIIRTAKDNEKIVTLDNREIVLDKDTLIIADEESPQAIAGVIGGKYSEINENTQNIFLEIAQFLPSSIRKTSQKFNIRTESSIRFEHGIDYEMLMPAANKTLALMSKLMNSIQISPINWIKAKESNTYPRKIVIDMYLPKINKLLGTNFETNKIINVLNKLGFETQPILSQDLYKITVPSWRYYDVTREADIIEEVARVIGYDNIPCTIPKSIGEVSKNYSFKLKQDIRNILQGLGLQEVYTYPLCSSNDEVHFKEQDKQTIYIENPLTLEQSELRTHLLSSLINVLKFNINKGKENINIFEIAPVFYYDFNNNIVEQTKLGVLMYGTLWQGIWKSPPSNLQTDFFTIKGILETLLEKINIKNYKILKTNKSYLHPYIAGEVIIDNNKIGLIGQLEPSLLKQLKIDKNVYYFELDFEILINLTKNINIIYTNVSKFPYAIRDISFFIDENIEYSLIYDSIKNSSKYIENLNLIDLYKGQNVPKDHKSMTFRIVFRAYDHTLEDNEIDKEIKSIKQNLIKLNAIIRE